MRVGLKYVRGLREEVGLKIVSERNGGFYSSIEDLVQRVPELNKREIRALSLAGALNFDGTIHRREALWESELAIQPQGSLFDDERLSRIAVRRSSASPAMVSPSSAAPPPVRGIASENILAKPTARQASPQCDAAKPADESRDQTPDLSNTKSQIPDPKSQIFLQRMEGLELIDADLRKTGISIGKHPMSFVRDEMTKLGIHRRAEART